MNTVEQRLEKLERSLSRYRKFTFMLALVIVAGLTLGQTKPDVVDVIRFHRLEVVDKELRTVAVLGERSLCGRLSIYKAEGKEEAKELIAVRAGPLGNGQLTVSSKEGKKLFAAESDSEDGDGLLAAFSKEGKNLIYAGADAPGVGVLATFSKEGKKLIAVGAGPLGNGVLIVSSKEGADRIKLASGDNGAWARLCNKTGEPIIELSADKYGNGVVGAYNRKGKGRTLEPGP